MLTVPPSDPAGQVPIGGLSSAAADVTNWKRPGTPADRTARPVPVATACRSKRRRESPLEEGFLLVVIWISLVGCSATVEFAPLIGGIFKSSCWFQGTSETDP